MIPVNGTANSIPMAPATFPPIITATTTVKGCMLTLLETTSGETKALSISWTIIKTMTIHRRTKPRFGGLFNRAMIKAGTAPTIGPR